MTPRPDPAAATQAKGSGIVTRLLPLAVIAAGIAAVFALDLDRYLSFQALAENRQALADFVAANHAVAALAFIGMYAVAVALSIPGAVFLTLGGGFLFGTVLGSLYVVIGATMGATIIFLAARTALGDMLRAKAGPWLSKLEDGFKDGALSYLLFLRLVPVFPFWLVNLVPAFLGVRLSTYVTATVIGIIPGCVVFASVGNGLGAVFDSGAQPDLSIIFQPAVLGPIVGLALLSLIPVAAKRLRARKS
ncbi:MAG: hypothetical protein RLY86_2106 [Pseudomonadota bacterium]|jgi:uncharacterized membrane protein YdjX (TVP38/TMEM64 family)